MKRPTESRYETGAASRELPCAPEPSVAVHVAESTVSRDALSVGSLTKALLPYVVRRLVRLMGTYLRRRAELYVAFRHDRARYWRWSQPLLGTMSRSQLRARITMGVHAIEKGLSLPSPRLQFGKSHITQLLTHLSEYIRRFGTDATTRSAYHALAAYRDFNVAGGASDSYLDESLRPATDLHEKKGDTPQGGIVRFRRGEIGCLCRIDAEGFFLSRHSIRDFSPSKVAPELIERAIRLAQHTPSACNRQPWRVYVFDEEEEKVSLLELQDGNRGFGNCSHVLCITSDLGCFVGARERNQAWIDGGMFGMTLLYALHALGLGACALNACYTAQADRRFREVVDLPDSEVLIMMIAVGHLPEEFRVAVSARRPLKDVLIKGRLQSR